MAWSTIAFASWFMSLGRFGCPDRVGISEASTGAPHVSSRWAGIRQQTVIKLTHYQWGKPTGGRWWTTSASRRSLPDERAVTAAVNYVREQAGALVVYVADSALR